MNGTLQAVAISCAMLAAASAAAVPSGTIGFTAYGSVANPQGGYDFVRLVPGNVVISHLDHAILSATFANGDYSKEYAIDDTGTLIAIDTSTGVVTPIGEPLFPAWTHIGMATAADGLLSYALVAESPCMRSDLFAIDRTTGSASLLSDTGGCLQSLAIGPDGTEYVLDRDIGALATLDGGAVGAIGFALDDADVLAYAPGSNVLLLFGFDPNVGTNNLYTVDTVTGLATLISPLGGDVPITGIVLAAPLPDEVFSSGFDG